MPYNYLTPRDYQEPLFAAMEKGYKRFVMVWARQHGKDTIAFCVMVMQAYKTAGQYFYVFPTSEDARRAAWEKIDHRGVPLLDAVPKELIISLSNQQMKITIKTMDGRKSIIRFLGLDTKPDKIRGITPAGVIYSEYAYQDPRAHQIIGPAIRKNPNCWVLYQSTPNGKNHFFRLYQHAVANPDVWFVSLVQNLNPDKEGFVGPALSKKEIEAIMAEDDYEYEDIEREYGCSFEVGGKGAIYTDVIDKAYEHGYVGDYPASWNHYVDTFWDIGYNDPTAIWFRQKINGYLHWIKYWEGSYRDPADVVKEVLVPTGFDFDTHYLPWDGNSRPSNGSDPYKDLLETALENSPIKVPGFVEVAPKIGKLDGARILRSKWHKMRWNEIETSEGIEHLMEYRKKFDKKRRVFVAEPEHDQHSHAADALRTMAAADYTGFESDSVSAQFPTLLECDLFDL